MNVNWASTALADLLAIHDYIAQASPIDASRLIDRLTNRSRQIREFPLSGRKVAEFQNEQLREVIEGSYRIIYHLQASNIEVIAVVHTSRDPFPRR